MRIASTDGLTSGRSMVPHLTVVGLGTTALGAIALGQPIRFAEPVRYTDTGGGHALAVADLDGDGDLDVAAEGNRSVHIYSNNGSGALEHQATIPNEDLMWELHAADMDADGHADLLWIERHAGFVFVLSIWYNSGDGRTGEVVQTQLPGFREDPGIRIADLNGDGLLDVVYAYRERTISALINLGDRTFEQPDIYEYDRSFHDVNGLVVGDFDGDGDVDVAATFQHTGGGRYLIVYSTQVVLLRNDGSFPLRLVTEQELPWRATNILALDMTAGDLDGDGDLDLVVAGTTYERSVPWSEFVFLRNDEAVSLTPMHTHRIAPPFPGALSLVDVNTDGRPDLVFRVHLSAGAYVVRNDGGLQFTGLPPFYTGTGGSTLAVSDLTGDGLYDFVQSGSSGFSVVENITEWSGPVLSVGPLVRGQPARFVVQRARPGESVHFLYSMDGIDTSVGLPLLGGLTLDLRHAVVLGSARADLSGRAVLQRTIPPNAPLAPLALQAVVRRGPNGAASVKTPFQVVPIEE